MSKKRWYATVRWCIEDVQGFVFPEMTEKKAHEWLAENEEHIQERLSEYGIEIIRDLIDLTSSEEEEEEEEEEDQTTDD